LIATPRNALLTCRSDDTLAAVMVRNEAGFDYFPVIDARESGRERIVGLIDLVPYVRGKKIEGIVQNQMERLSEDNMIGADAGILTFVKTADRNGCRLVMSGAEISGLVTLSDMQQLPVRAALFALITHLEMTMTEAIRREFDGSDQWKTRLSEERLAGILSKRDKAMAADTEVDELLFTQFDDKITIIRKSSRFAGSKSAFEREMKEARDLRDNLAHANEYAATREAAARVCDTVRTIEHWIAQLSNWPSKQTPGGR
jgi:CBS domain-containing protein